MLNFLDNTSATLPLKVALIFEDQTYTYAELCRLTQCLAASLLERGINPGDRIAFLLPNCPQIVLCYYACFKIGAIAVPLNVRFGPELLKYAINHSGARVLISEPELFAQIDKMRSSLPGIEEYYLTSRPSQFNDVRPFDELSLNFCFSAGEAIPVAIQERFRRIFGIEITEGCGMTELQIYSMNPRYGEKKIGSIGKPIAGIQISLIDDSHSPIPRADEIGEIIVQAGSMTTGYWRDPELTARHISEGWFHTGELAYRDEEDFYWFVSRKSEIIKHQAGLVSPIEIEGVLYQHPAVREAGVIGVPDRFGHELPQAYVVLQKSSAPVTEQQLIDFAGIGLPAYKVPHQVIFADNLPHGPTGKIDRKTLRENALSLDP